MPTTRRSRKNAEDVSANHPAMKPSKPGLHPQAAQDIDVTNTAHAFVPPSQPQAIVEEAAVLRRSSFRIAGRANLLQLGHQPHVTGATKRSYEESCLPTTHPSQKRAKIGLHPHAACRTVGRTYVPLARPQGSFLPSNHLFGGNYENKYYNHPFYQHIRDDVPAQPISYTATRPADAPQQQLQPVPPSPSVSRHVRNVAIQSVEEPGQHRIAGVTHYKKIIAQLSANDPIKSSSFEEPCPRPTKGLSKPEDVDAKESPKPTLRPRDPHIDFTKMPQHRRPGGQQYPAFKGVTSNPLVALAIIRIAEKNLPFVDFSSALNHLPDYDSSQALPEWRDDFVDHPELDPKMPATGSFTRVVFLSRYYADGRHAIGFYNRKMGTCRYGAALFTPCTTDDLRDAKLLLQVSPGADGNGSEDCDDFVIGSRGGEWFHPDVVEECETWKALVLAEENHKIRFALTTREIREEPWSWRDHKILGWDKKD